MCSMMPKLVDKLAFQMARGLESLLNSAMRIDARTGVAAGMRR